jgi:hydroxyacid-oxoacid transhydrogenase
LGDNPTALFYFQFQRFAFLPACTTLYNRMNEKELFMHCCAYYNLTGHEGDPSFTVDVNQFTFGRGALNEVGDHAKALGMKRVAIMTDPTVAKLPVLAQVKNKLAAAGVDAVVYAECSVEPTDASFQAAGVFAREGKFDGFISLGGGSVMDTTKAANLLATYPDDFLAYVNAPIGQGKAVPGALKPHIACPTTVGTGSEVTGVAIFYLSAMQAKTGMISRYLLPSRALIDPDVAKTLPAGVIAANGFDAISHSLEAYTARAHSTRPAAANGALRPMNQGANMWSDMGAREALRLLGLYLERAVTDASDDEAREKVMFAATVAGMTFSNTGCHLPHGMSYAVGGLIQSANKDFKAPIGYPQTSAMVPHGMAVVLTAPSVYRFTGCACPERHLEAARALGADTTGAIPDDAGEIVAKRLIGIMQRVKYPNGLRDVGYTEADAPALAERAWPQKRVIDNAPRLTKKEDLEAIFRASMRYW